MNSPRAPLLLLCCTACWKETHRPACSEPVYTELADDEPSPMGIAPDSLLALATPGWAGVADHFGSEVDAAFTVARGEGPALFVDTDEIDIVTRRYDLGGGDSTGRGDSTFLLASPCEDWVEVPADFTIVSEEAEIDLDMDATIRSPDGYTQGLGSGADIEASIPYEQSGLVVEGIDDTYDKQTIEVSLSMLVAAQQSTGDVYWYGSEQDRASTQRILSWDGD